MIPGIVAGHPVAAAWTPAALSPSLWLDDGSSVTDASGAASQWNDRSSNGWHVTQASAGSRPAIISSGLNGLRVLRFDGNDRLQNNSTGARDIFRAVEAGWAFIVFKRGATDGGATDRHLLMVSNNTSGTTRFIASSGSVSGANRPRLAARRQDGDSTALLTSATAGGTAWTMMMMTMDWSTGAGAIYIDGSLDSSNGSLTSAGPTSNTASIDPLTVGSASNSAGGHFNGDIAAMLARRSSIPDAGDIDRLFGYYAHRYDLAGNLDAGHPYKSAPP